MDQEREKWIKIVYRTITGINEKDGSISVHDSLLECQKKLSKSNGNKIDITEKTRKKKEADPFMIFANEEKERIKEEFPHMSATEVNKLIRHNWNALSELERQNLKLNTFSLSKQ